MENIKLGEQPNVNYIESKDDANMQIENMAQQNSLVGSPLNKFKDFGELEKAYVNLEKEFTKKCQELKSLKEHGDNVSLNETPEYAQQDWAEKVKTFFENNPSAKNFANEIESVLTSDKVLASSKNSLENAFEKVRAKNFKTNDEIINDENFVNEYVLKNSSIKEKIINDYLQEIMAGKVAPLISSNNGANIYYTPKSKPSSIKEAGNYMLAMMNDK